MPAMPTCKSNLHPIAVLQPPPLKCVSTQARYPMSAMPARKRNLYPIAVLQTATLKCVLKLQRINRTTVVVARIPDSAAHIIDGGEGWPTAVVSFDIMLI